MKERAPCAYLTPGTPIHDAENRNRKSLSGVPSVHDKGDSYPAAAIMELTPRVMKRFLAGYIGVSTAQGEPLRLNLRFQGLLRPPVCGRSDPLAGPFPVEFSRFPRGRMSFRGTK